MKPTGRVHRLAATLAAGEPRTVRRRRSTEFREAWMKIKIIENGPIVLDTEGQISIASGGSTEEKAGPVFLCRCGRSSTKPFCDGTHRKCDFEGPASELSCP